ncbi:MAG: NifU family protein [Bacteroidales bacterium]|jgi:Fe-S cluster biogenesis protein NfuA|uniref:Fe/S biogenesis protein NfuA n=1 Tax=bioreactor metagenome TaxID=1076179 RepID=A0A644U3P7_9ZZZZ|nr:NifU family protein [Bacteroidales bacterium]MEA4968682.1 NifU family protein [Bacteroidaceae bacterium]NCC17839.1 NifU family protein [Bacteroidia bacterium]MDD3287097.1 NifU family protein [Bacteroidales bacterium]MDD4067628.1 NifU family protein [Bacteroidales bacterium]
MTPQEKQDLEIKVKEVLNKIRPYLQNDGGDLRFVELTDDKVVYVELQGHCGSCPHAMMTLKQGVEQAVIEELPEIKAVERYM